MWCSPPMSDTDRSQSCTPHSPPRSPRHAASRSTSTSGNSGSPAQRVPRVDHSGDTWPVRARMTSSRLVGRIGELAELELAWREAAAGRPGLVLLGGESGVGKTRLLSELRQRLAGESALVLRGEG